MLTYNNLKPVVICDNGHVTNYYGSYIATIKDGYEPSDVLKVCQGKRKTHKGKRFCFLEDLGILGEKILADIEKKRGGE